MARSQLCRDENLFDFFHEQVGTAITERGGDVSEEGVFYLSNLLVERGRAPAGTTPDTLVELQLQAAEAPRTRQIRAWRELGDRALYTSGFFRSSLERRAVSLDYYVQMGAAAYGRLSHMISSPAGHIVGGHRGLDEIFAELARRFSQCSDVLLEVRAALRAQTTDESDMSVLALYEEWLATGSPAVAARLQALGVTPMRPPAGPDAC